MKQLIIILMLVIPYTLPSQCGTVKKDPFDKTKTITYLEHYELNSSNDSYNITLLKEKENYCIGGKLTNVGLGIPSILTFSPEDKMYLAMSDESVITLKHISYYSVDSEGDDYFIMAIFKISKVDLKSLSTKDVTHLRIATDTDQITFEIDNQQYFQEAIKCVNSL